MKLNIFNISFDNGMPWHPFFKNLYNNPPENISFVQEYERISDDDINNHLNIFVQKCLEANIPANIIDGYIEYLNSVGAINNSMEMKLGIPVWVAVLPQYVGPNDWILEVEDFWLAFLPWLSNGMNYDVDLKTHWIVQILRVLFEMENCKQIITHTKDTLNFIKIVFGEKVFAKTSFCQQSVNIDTSDIKNTPKSSDITTFLFHGSWNHTQDHFFLRGGLETINAFESVYKINPNCKLIVNYNSDNIPKHIVHFLETHPGIEYYPKYLSDDEIKNLRLRSDVFIIPAYRLHSMSTLTSMCYGNPIICSDGWGFDEYVTNNYNGVICKGQLCSFYDDEGIMRENYSLGDRNTGNQNLQKNIENAMLLLSTNNTIYNNMRFNCIDQYYKNHTNEIRNNRFNQIMKQIFINLK
jgi:glycosyltransferase involved in cell wall biosynthesis